MVINTVKGAKFWPRGLLDRYIDSIVNRGWEILSVKFNPTNFTITFLRSDGRVFDRWFRYTII